MAAVPTGIYTATGNNNLGTYVPESLTYDETETSLTLDFQGSLGTPMLQNVSVTPVPEPASLLLFSLGAIGVGVVAYRRRGKLAVPTREVKGNN